MPDNNLFSTARLDGRSDKRVVADLIAAAAAHDVLTYDALRDALQEGVPGRTFTRSKICQVVRGANAIALIDCQRCLQAIPRVGYRVAAAEQHRKLAGDHHRKANTQIRMAADRLIYVRWDEMSPAAREAHQATLVLISGIALAIQSLEQRQNHTEAMLRRVLQMRSA